MLLLYLWLSSSHSHISLLDHRSLEAAAQPSPVPPQPTPSAVSPTAPLRDHRLHPYLHPQQHLSPVCPHHPPCRPRHQPRCCRRQHRSKSIPRCKKLRQKLHHCSPSFRYPAHFLKPKPEQTRLQDRLDKSKQFQSVQVCAFVNPVLACMLGFECGAL